MDENKVRNAIIKECRMSDEMKYFTINEAYEGINKTPNNEGLAHYLKIILENTYKGSTWHVIVGRNFGSYVTHQDAHLLYFYIGQKGFLIFKTPKQRNEQLATNNN